MGATNAKTVDLRAFGLRTIESPSLTASVSYVNRVLRFLAQLDPPWSTKKARGKTSHGLRRPASVAALRRRPTDSVPLGADGGKVAFASSTFILYSSELETGSVPLHIERGRGNRPD